MDKKALILLTFLAVANSHSYYDHHDHGHIFPNIHHFLNDMLDTHRNRLLGNRYKQDEDTIPTESQYGSDLDSGYQQNNRRYQNEQPSQLTDLNNNNNQPYQDDSIDPNDPIEGLSTGKSSDTNAQETSSTHSPNSPEPSTDTPLLSTDKPFVTNLNKSPVVINKNLTPNINIKKEAQSLTNTIQSNKNKNAQNINQAKVQNVPKNANKDPLLIKKSDLIKESLKINKPRDPNQIIFPDQQDEIKKEAQKKYEDNTSTNPNKNNDSPKILYAVNIDPSNRWNNVANTPLTNSPTTQHPPLSNSQTFSQIPSSFATFQTPNSAPLTNKMAEANPLGNSIVLPNPNGSSTLYTIVNLPNTIANADVPSQYYQTSNILSNPSNYQQQTSVPVANSGIINGIPSYYVVSLPNQPVQNPQVTLPYTNAPIQYTIGYLSSNGQTVLVPSSTVVYQLVPQKVVPVSGQGVVSGQNTYVPITNVVSQPVVTGQSTVATPQTYISVPSSQVNTGNTQISYVPVTNVQQADGNAQINYVPVPNTQSNTDATQPHYVTLSNDQGTSGDSQVNYVPVTNGQETAVNTQNVIPVTSDLANVATLTSAASNAVVLPPDTTSVTLIGFNDKADVKENKKEDKEEDKKEKKH